MGNKQAKSGKSKAAATTGSGNEEKVSLYTETRDMVAISFLAYAFGYAIDVSRKVDGGLKGLQNTSKGGVVKKTTNQQQRKSSGREDLEIAEEKKQDSSSSLVKASTSSSNFYLQRSFTPSEILKILELNRGILAHYYPSTFGGNDSGSGGSGSRNSKKKTKSTQYDMIIDNLMTMQQRADALSQNQQRRNHGGNYRPITIEEYDDKHQKHELVYGIIKDDVAQRITLVFRGTDSSLAFKSNWTTNIRLLKTNFAGHKHHNKGDKKTRASRNSSRDSIRKSMKDVFGGITNVRVHSGFYNYIFGLTKNPNDPETYRKYDEIVHDLNVMFTRYPNYKLYVTGHSLGAALSTLVAFSLASCDDNKHSMMPKPITCINFASPRVGNKNFMKACQSLEQKNKIRFLRVVNDNDTIAFVPMTNYHHVGFQVRLYKSKNVKPVLTYPSKQETWSKYTYRLWSNSLPASLNLRYDHGDYRQRVEQNKEFFQKLDLESMYQDKNLTGF